MKNIKFIIFSSAIFLSYNNTISARIVGGRIPPKAASQPAMTPIKPPVLAGPGMQKPAQPQPVAQQPSSVKDIFNAVKTKKSLDVINAQGALQPQFITWVESLTSDRVLQNSLLLAGLTLHSNFTDQNYQTKLNFISEAINELLPIQSVQPAQPKPMQPPAQPVAVPEAKPLPQPIAQPKSLTPEQLQQEKTLFFIELQENYKHFTTNIRPFPTQSNNINAVADNSITRQNKIVEFAQTTYPLVDISVLKLCDDFLTFKKNYGSSKEKALYQNMTLPHFIIRCFEKRPLVFLAPTDLSILRNPQSTYQSRDFTKIGTEEEESPLILNDYLSYDEMKISALLGLSSPTYFINTGDRMNKGRVDQPGTFEEEGVYCGLVGARFEKQNFMEWQDIIITEEQNTSANGYGLEANNTGLRGIWSTFYGMKFPTFQEAETAHQNGNQDYIKFEMIGVHGIKTFYFNIPAYKKRLEVVLDPFLRDANERGKNAHKKVYVHTVAIGIGAWAIALKTQQTKAMVEVYKKIIQDNNLAHIADIDFSWFDEYKEQVPGMTDNTIIKDTSGNEITIHFSNRNPADKLTGDHEQKLLVASYAWDGNAYPGNEYWNNNLTGSGDPAAACCSLITTLQNILINYFLRENIETMFKKK